MLLIAAFLRLLLRTGWSNLDSTTSFHQILFSIVWLVFVHKHDIMKMFASLAFFLLYLVLWNPGYREITENRFSVSLAASKPIQAKAWLGCTLLTSSVLCYLKFSPRFFIYLIFSEQHLPPSQSFQHAWKELEN